MAFSNKSDNNNRKAIVHKYLEDIDVSVADQDVSQSGKGVIIWVGSSGDIECDLEEGGKCIIPNVPVGFLPASITKVYTASTTASNMLAFL